MSVRTTNTTASQSDTYELQNADGSLVTDSDNTQVYYKGPLYTENTTRTVT